MSSAIEKKLLHYVKKAIADYQLIQKKNERVMVCLSGGKDSYALLKLLSLLRVEWHYSFELMAYTLDQMQPGWDDSAMRAWLTAQNIPFVIERRNTYAVVTEKIPQGKTYCSLCSRLRRGNIYRYAKEHGMTKIALGHHRDDLIHTFLLSALYQGEIRSMPPKLLTDNRQHIVIRPLVYCQEQDIITYAAEQRFPLIPCTLCGSQENLMRKRVKQWVQTLAAENPKIPSNLLHALSAVRGSQLMDKQLWDFKNLDALRIPHDLNQEVDHETEEEPLF